MHVARVGGLATDRRRTFATTWAPSVARFGQTLRARLRRPAARPSGRARCASRTSTSQLAARRVRRPPRPPLICPPARGAIDPAFFTGVRGGRYLLWKRRADAAARRASLHQPALGERAAGHRHRRSCLLTTQDAWESPLIENPAMIRYRGRLLPLLLRRLLRQRLLRDRLRDLRLAVRSLHPGLDQPAARDRRPGRRARRGDAVPRPRRPAAAGVRRLGLRQHRLPDDTAVPAPAAGLPAAQAARRDARGAEPTAPWWWRRVARRLAASSALRRSRCSSPGPRHGRGASAAAPGRATVGNEPFRAGHAVHRQLPGPDGAAGRARRSTRPPPRSPR